MAYADLLPDIREALGVSSAHDASLTAALTRNARYLLRNFNFRESVRRTAGLPIALDAVAFAIPADAGKVKAVRLRQLSGAVYAYKRLRRREEGMLPQPVNNDPLTVRYYWFEYPNVLLDTPMPEEDVEAEVWYQTVDPAIAEAWLSTVYADVLLHRTVYELAPTKRKPEAMQIYSALWQEDMAVLANYLQELEFNDLELRMGEEKQWPGERYPSG